MLIHSKGESGAVMGRDPVRFRGWWETEVGITVTCGGHTDNDNLSLDKPSILNELGYVFCLSFISEM